MHTVQLSSLLSILRGMQYQLNKLIMLITKTTKEKTMYSRCARGSKWQSHLAKAIYLVTT